MHWQHREPPTWPADPGVTVLEAAPGEARDAVVARWLAQRTGGPTWHLRCRPQEGGTWAGLSTLVADLVPALREQAPDLLARHAQELSVILPALRLDFARNLTDVADDEEKTRNYPADRAYRHLHGLIELLGEWHTRAQPGPWSIACVGFEDANALVRRFFRELARRRGERLSLRLLLVAGEGRGAEAAGELDPVAAVRLALPGVEESPPDPAAMTRLATELEAGVTADPDARLPRLIDAWQRSDAPERALRWQVLTMGRYNHDGLYEASLPYVDDVEAALERLYAEDRALYFSAVSVLYFTYVPLGRAEAARDVLERALPRVEGDVDVARLSYLLAMLYARFLVPADQERAEYHLQQGLARLAAADVPDDERQFHTVFTMNGLALVRLRQGRVHEALELCAEGVARLEEHLDPDRHRLHRSVLLFNIAQIHAQIGPYEDAVAAFTEAMAMDPNYSEYYNDRGSVYLKMGRLEDAERDYRRAIELSPPYAEVWANLGQCYRAMERMDDAVEAYSRALDLDPEAALALVGRAEALAALGRTTRALEDYDRALSLEPAQPLVLASRAILHYEAARLPAALADLDAAVALAGDVPELYQNRAVALQELERFDEAARDLETYLDLSPDAGDRGDVEDALAELRSVR